MSDADTFLSLPSLLRQAMERSAGANGLEALTREKPVPYVIVSPEDWRTIRDFLIDMQETIVETAKPDVRTDMYIDGAQRLVKLEARDKE